MTIVLAVGLLVMEPASFQSFRRSGLVVQRQAGSLSYATGDRRPASAALTEATSAFTRTCKGKSEGASIV